MITPPYSFGSVLYDELEQVAVRRGGFASLKSLRDEVFKARRAVQLSAAGTDPLVDLRKKTDAVARDAEELLGA